MNKLRIWLKSNQIDDGAFSAMSDGEFSPEAVRKWRFGVRTPRSKNMRTIARLTSGAVTANDFMETLQKSEAA